MTKVEQNEKNMNPEDFVEKIFASAIQEGASDIHFEPLSEKMRIRFRINGILENKKMLDKSLIEPIINKIKVLSGMDITNREAAQDGHFELYEIDNSENKGKESSEGSEQVKAHKKKSNDEKKDFWEKRVLDVRVSVYPTLKGEVIVARILNRLDALMNLTELGMDKSDLSSISKFISKDYGMLLITGPAGSGKTTTLYSFLQELKDESKNIMTIEDPVEFHLEWLRQSELKPARGFTFTNAIRSILRQDPDVIMVGEIRDEEAASHAISASLVGRIVGSTVHSNSTMGTIARLIDMNIDRSMIAYAINGIISQRLARTNCPNCKELHQPDPDILEYFGLRKDQYEFYKGKGCQNCKETGFVGRVGLFEVVAFDSKIRSLIVSGAPMEELENYVFGNGNKDLKQDAINKAVAGLISIEEAARMV
ncbi:MAG: hypothetical protein COV70_02175 [Parcubacteria group bacterium CG11_big_fil_rev_8_21_14_0_20_39_22]|nr:MAG: hypothetical protein COV70_02175 [Parcubacteria group bacterium CG11_big_fil_rev_8_21_14_0_20_39_22]